MINNFLSVSDYSILGFLGVAFAYFGTCVLLGSSMNKLPKDHGRAYAHDGILSAGKPRGAGFIFILAFVIATLLFGNLERETIIYLILTVAAMMTGFLDDCAKVSWGRLRKGLLDLVIAVMTALTMVNFNGSEVLISLTGQTYELPPLVYGILAVILVWGSINVTNCADGVDGLSGTLSTITLSTIYFIMQTREAAPEFSYLILLFIACILGYLWYNATPSSLMMGDAGSRAIGLFIAIAIMKTGSPFLYVLVAFVLMVDGGIGLVKVALLRFLKIKILTKVRTPLHDHVRKNRKWSNAQTVFKFAIIQIMISAAVVWLSVI
ncbi:MAG: phospho-N-acetylmuramoyl-pentapeptide-transferase [Lachnospiraceae bacterium]|jgi:phospho-N-acetylmuramoyl-pentapeptide-transferase|nr:phospho-N-acetylmuramoyl-pentapeptide-transferase [Lachnospiraceae bacterium]MCI9398330.1 phospho-N-acetylmuramoyl-pentapeptide-transferase [Lachnospiraceae bacterium]MCX4377278.1 phospho-N-acetylmuramoyl-pentapeptide-transferase [Lachnospiraceae bacterium]